MKVGGRQALVTGATRGIGAAIAASFTSAGVEVIGTGTDSAAIAALEESGAPVSRWLSVDFSDADSTRDFLDRVEELDRLDVLVNNAGINIIKPVEDVTEADFDALTAVNYRAPYLVARSASRVMKRSGGGRIVNIGSIWSVVTRAGRSLYAGSKAGLVGFTRGLAVDLAVDGILVNCVSPGFVLTDLTRESMTEAAREEVADRIPARRLAEPAEIAKVVRFLCSTDNTYLTGQNIVVDGGFSIV